MSIFNSNNSKKIKELEDKILNIEERQETFIRHIGLIVENLTQQSKAKYVWELRKEEVDLIEDGKKFRKIVGFIN